MAWSKTKDGARTTHAYYSSAAIGSDESLNELRVFWTRVLHELGTFAPDAIRTEVYVEDGFIAAFGIAGVKERMVNETVYTFVVESFKAWWHLYQSNSPNEFESINAYDTFLRDIITYSRTILDSMPQPSPVHFYDRGDWDEYFPVK